MPVGYIKAGAPIDGRQNYVFTDPKTNKRLIASIPEENVDKFEKVNDEMNKCFETMTTPEYKQIQEKNAKKMEKTIKLSIILGGALGAIIPAAIAIAVKGSVLKRSIIGSLTSLVGAGIGAVGGFFGSAGLSSVNNIKKDPQIKQLASLYKQAETLGFREERMEG